MTTTIHISGLYTDPPFLIHLASDLHHWFCPQASLLPCWLGFRQMGLAPYNGTHPLGNINQFHVIIDTPKIPDLARHEQAIVSLFYAAILTGCKFTRAAIATRESIEKTLI